MSPPTDDEQILNELKERRKNIILALYRHGRLGAGKLRSITGTPRGSKEHHYETLQRWGLMERIGEQQERGGNPERVFALTDDGTAFVEKYLVDTDEAPDAYAVKIKRTEDKVDELRGTIEDLERTVEQQADEIEQLRKDREDAFDTCLDRLENKLNGEYKTMIEQSIKSDLQLDSDHE